MQKFNYEETSIEGLKIVYPIIAEDSRGYFLKSFEKKSMEKIGIVMNVSEINESMSSKGVIRGIHFQKEHPQAKLIRVEEGEIFDVAVDLRKESISFGNWVGVRLSKINKKMFYLPKGFGHGFLTLSDTAIITYTCDGDYLPNDEVGIRWDDTSLKINWPLQEVPDIILSDKDKKWPHFEDIF